MVAALALPFALACGLSSAPGTNGKPKTLASLKLGALHLCDGRLRNKNSAEVSTLEHWASKITQAIRDDREGHGDQITMALEFLRALREKTLAGLPEDIEVAQPIHMQSMTFTFPYFVPSQEKATLFTRGTREPNKPLRLSFVLPDTHLHPTFNFKKLDKPRSDGTALAFDNVTFAGVDGRYQGREEFTCEQMLDLKAKLPPALERLKGSAFQKHVNSLHRADMRDHEPKLENKIKAETDDAGNIFNCNAITQNSLKNKSSIAAEAERWDHCWDHGNAVSGYCICRRGQAKPTDDVVNVNLTYYVFQEGPRRWLTLANVSHGFIFQDSNTKVTHTAGDQDADALLFSRAVFSLLNQDFL